MNMKAKILAAGICGAALIGGGVAWACTVQPRILSLIPLSGAAGSRIAIGGQGIAPEAGVSPGLGPSEVEIRWDGIGGPVIGRATPDRLGNFSTEVTIPAVPAGVYTIVAAAGDEGIARTAFEVIEAGVGSAPSRSAAERGPTSDLWTGFPAGPGQLAAAEGGRAASSPAGLAGLTMVAVGVVALAGVAVAAGRRRTSQRRG